MACSQNKSIPSFEKRHNPNTPTGVILICTVVEDNSDLEVEDIEREPASAKVFTARADVRQGKKPASRSGITEPVRDSRMRATKQIAQK
jgi:hypothetical protein